MNDHIKKQIALLTKEQKRAKHFLSANRFECTTVPYAIVKEYRDKLKAHIKVLQLYTGDRLRIKL